MFTGIVQNMGRVKAANRTRLEVEASKTGRMKLGDSLAVNGVCLTVVRKTKGRLSFDLSRETLKKTNLSQIKAGDPVNLESPLRLSEGLGGHIVQGHVDGVGRVRDIKKRPDSTVMWINAPAGIKKAVVSKGSITVDGVSLTVAKRDAKGFSVALIPFTLKHTTLGALKKGARVNLEADIMAKYVLKALKKIS